MEKILEHTALTSSENKNTAYPSLICFFVSLFFFYEFLQMTMFNTLSISLLKDFSINSTQLGSLAAAYFYTLTIMLLPIGIIIDRFPMRKLFLVCLGISVMGTVLFSIATTFHEAFLCRIFSGIGGGFAFLICLRVAASLFPPTRLPIVIAFITTLAFLGALVAQTPLTWLVLKLGWRHGMQVIAFFGMLIWIINFLYSKNLPEPIQNQALSPRIIFSSVKKAIFQKQTWLGGLYVSLMNMPVVILGASWGAIYLQQTHHLSPILASYITSLLFVGILIGSPMIGWLFTKVKTKKNYVIIGAAVLFLISFLLFLGNFLSPIELGIIFFIMGFFSGSQCFGYTVVIENNSPEITATASSIGSILIMMVSALAKVIYGDILNFGWTREFVDKVPIYSTHVFLIAMMVLPISFLISVIIALFIKLK